MMSGERHRSDCPAAASSAALCACGERQIALLRAELASSRAPISSPPAAETRFVLPPGWIFVEGLAVRGAEGASWRVHLLREGRKKRWGVWWHRPQAPVSGVPQGFYPSGHATLLGARRAAEALTIRLASVFDPPVWRVLLADGRRVPAGGCWIAEARGLFSSP